MPEQSTPSVALERLFIERQRLLDELDEIRMELDGVTARIIENLPPGGIEFDGHWWKSRADTKTTWDHARVISTLATRAISMREPNEHGEIIDPGLAVAKAFEKCAGVSYWRKTALVDFDMDPEQYCDRDYGRKKLVPQKIADGGHDEGKWTSSPSSASSPSEPPGPPSSPSDPTGPSVS